MAGGKVMTLAEKAERAARKRTQRDIERAPLLDISGDLHHWTGDEMQAEWDRYAARLEQFNIEQVAQADVFRTRVAELISPEGLVQLDVRRKMYPRAGCYSVDFWRRELMKLEVVSDR